jgi:hypothetical protein
MLAVNWVLVPALRSVKRFFRWAAAFRALSLGESWVLMGALRQVRNLAPPALAL